MGLMPGNEPSPPRGRSSSLISWIVLLILFGPTLYHLLRNATTGWLTNEQWLMLLGGLIAIVGLAAIVRQVSRRSEGSAASLSPSAYESAAQRRSTTTTLRPPEWPALPPVIVQRTDRDLLARLQDARPDIVARQAPAVPQAPRFEPMITGKAVLGALLVTTLLLGSVILLLG
ncbi:hypothetical protein [Kallotenue papyrolyticum]|uniref:hypothetical protein n=1 Tax=Kallotenue papyrolyticum TaxID=1325125 RepID=UPI0004786494|nr:hypothetical protein [Kallotenue papyrolyticum]